MPDLLLRDIAPEQLRRDITDDVIAALRSLLLESHEPRLVGRQRMAELLDVGLATLDRMTSAGTVPSVLVQSRRKYEPRHVIDTLASQTKTEATE